ncbi:MAG: PEP-CTERM sorting domain-containing protein [Desulfobacteraceae bacterium]|nr:PEP-CTERM sorting domain-containing protein [Desulfobacteraceae bacterium]
MTKKFLLTLLFLTQVCGFAWAGTFSFTTTDEWGTGVLTSTNTSEPPDTGDGHVRLNDAILTPFNHIWVALSGRGTVARIDTNVNPTTLGNGDTYLTEAEASGMAVLGEYYTAPSGLGRDPSRTTVDANGDVWVGNRAQDSGQGSVAKISANPTNPTGAPVVTSNGIFGSAANGGAAGTFNALSWTNSGGADSAGGVTTATDDAQMLYVRTSGTAVRAVAVDANNDVWVGGYNNKQFQLYDGDSGTPVAGSGNSFNAGAGGYGAVVDGNGVVWSAGLNYNSLVKHDPATNTTQIIANGRYSYGMGIDNNGKLWVSNWTDNTVQRIDTATGVVEGTFAAYSGMRGVAVTPDNDIWVAASYSNGVMRMNNDGSIQTFIPTGDHPTGVAVDSNGKVWVTNYNASTVSRIDPTLNGGDGGVDMTLYLGSGANPYNYSDMTGTVLLGSTTPQGTWRKVVDGGIGADWGQILWNQQDEGDIPDSTGLLMEARVSDDQSTWSDYIAFDSGDDLGLLGRYLEVRATLSRTGGTNLTPVLSDLRIDYTPGNNVVPEPGTMMLLGLGLLGLAGMTRRNKK